MKHLLLWLSGLLLISRVLQAAPSLPASVFFVPNLGQWDGAFLFYYENGTLSGYVTTDGLTLDLHEPLKPQPRPENAPPLNPPRKRGGNKAEDTPIIRKGHVLMLDIVGGKQDYIEGTELLASYSNYFLSRDSCRWRGHVPNYKNLLAHDVWPGIDIEYKATLNGIETVFHVQPGADPNRIQLRYRGADAPISVDANGRLQLVTSMGTIFEQAPFAFQIIDNRQQSVPVAYHLLGDNTYNLTLGSYDRSRELVIDPLVYSTYVPGWASSFCADQQGNLVLAGTAYYGFPTTPGAYLDTCPQASCYLYGFITKLNNAGNAIVYSTLFPMVLQGTPNIRVDRDGNFYFSGSVGTYTGWPLTPDAFDTTCASNELGLIRLSPDGSQLLYCTYLGGAGGESGPEYLELDSAGNVYMYGNTDSNDFPLTPNAWATTIVDEGTFITVFNAGTMIVQQSTYLPFEGGPNNAWTFVPQSPNDIWIVTDVDQSAYAPTSPNAFQPTYDAAYDRMNYIAQLDLDQHDVTFGTFMGGLRVDGNGSIDIRRIWPIGQRLWICGFGSMEGLGVQLPPSGYQPQSFNNSYDALVIALDLPGTLRYGTYFGGESGDWASAIYVESGGSILIAGSTSSVNFPVTPDAFDSTRDSGPEHGVSDVFVARFTPDLDSLLYSSYFGGFADDAVYGRRGAFYSDAPNRIWVAGNFYGWDFPLTPDALWTEESGSFLMHLSFPPYGNADPVVITPASLPTSFNVSCYPNPFNPSTTISFTIPKSGSISLRVYDVLGREVAVLLDQRLNAGEHSVVFDADGLSSGVYFARLETSGMQRVQKMVVMR